MLKKPTASWITPFMKQCFVVLGVSLTLGQMGLVMGFPSVLLPQLKMAGSAIPISDEEGSWIASLPAISVMGGNLLIPVLMGKFGRKVGYITALLIAIVGWSGIAFSHNVPLLLAIRSLQGIGVGMALSLCPLLIGEYSSPVNRGVFLLSISIVIGIGIFAIHTMGSYLSWIMTSYICIAIAIVNFLFAIVSPESPCWLADQGRYDECREAFRWLRGDDEEDELEKMIEANIILRKEWATQSVSTDSCATKIRNGLTNLGQTLTKTDFYKPMAIMTLLYSLAQWSGANLVATYAVDFIHTVVGKDIDLPVMIMSVDIQRIISNAVALMVIKRIKRRMLLFTSIGLNALTLFLIAAFTYAKLNGFIPLDDNYNFYIGIALVHLLVFTVAVGALPLCFILAGEIFPLRYKSIAGGISSIFFSLNLFINLKTVPLLLSTVNVYGLYMVYGCIIVAFIIVIGLMLPETKDKTLQEIEEEFRGNKKMKPAKGPDNL